MRVCGSPRDPKPSSFVLAATNDEGSRQPGLPETLILGRAPNHLGHTRWMAAADDTPPWIELLVRMCAGESAERPFVGILEVPYEEDDDRWPPTVRVFKDRERYRVEALDGRLLTIRQAARTYVFHENHVPVRLDDDEEGDVHHGAHGSIIRRRQPRDWRGDDFTKPAGPSRAVTYLGRQAWEVELTPPPHKPSALVLTIDAANGMTLAQRSVEFGLISRWTEFTEVDGHPDDLFVWEGEVVWGWVEESEFTDEDEAEERRQDAEATARLGIAPLSVSIDLSLHVYETDDSGAFYAGFRTDMYGTVQRRPRSNEPWDLDQNFEHEERWSDATWDWCVASDGVPEQLSSIRAQLAEPRPDHE